MKRIFLNSIVANDLISSHSSLSKTHGLLQFILLNKPIKTNANQKRTNFSGRNVFEYIILLQNLEWQSLDDYFLQKLEILIQKCDKHNIIQKPVMELYMIEIQNLRIKLSSSSKVDTNFQDNKVIMGYNKTILKGLEQCVVKTSLYYIKRYLEELWFLIKPLEKPPEINVKQIRSVADIILDAIHDSIKVYEDHYKTVFIGDSASLSHVRKLLDEEFVDGSDIWVHLSTYYYIYLDRLELLLIKKLCGTTSNIEIESLLHTLIFHPSSFLTSKKTPFANWKLIDSLWGSYTEFPLVRHHYNLLKKASALEPVVTTTSYVIVKVKQRDAFGSESTMMIAIDSEEDISHSMIIEENCVSSVVLRNFGALSSSFKDFGFKEFFEAFTKTIRKAIQRLVQKLERQNLKLLMVEKLIINLNLSHYRSCFIQEINELIECANAEIKQEMSVDFKQIDWDLWYQRSEDTNSQEDTDSQEDEMTIKVKYAVRQKSIFDYKYLETMLFRNVRLDISVKTSVLILTNHDLKKAYINQMYDDTLQILANRTGFLNSFTLTKDYGKITYQELFKKLTQFPEEPLNKHWISSLRSEVADNFTYGSLALIRNYFRANIDFESPDK